MIPSKINPKNITLIQYNQIVNSQRQRRNFESSKRKRQITYKGTLMKLSEYFSAEILKTRREGYDIFKMLGKKNKKNMTTKNTICSKAVL